MGKNLTDIQVLIRRNYIVSQNSSYFPNRRPLSYPKLTKNMKTFISYKHHQLHHQAIKQLEPQQKYRRGTISNIKLLGGKHVLWIHNLAFCFCSGPQHFVSCLVLVVNLLLVNESSRTKYINYDNHNDESKTKTHRYNKLPDDGDSSSLTILSKRKTPGASCSKLTMSLLTIRLKFQMAILQIQLFLVEKNVRILCNAKSTKTNSVFAYVVGIYLTS